MFFVHTTLEELKNVTITGHFEFVVGENSERGNHVIIVAQSRGDTPANFG